MNIEQRIIQLLADFTRTNIDRIGAKTRLAEDLGLDGDDAGEFLALFSSQFNVDMKRFPYDVFFGPEGGWSPFVPFGVRKAPLTVEMLMAAAGRGEWHLIE